MDDYKVTKRETVFTTSWFNIEADTISGKKLPYYVMRLPDYVTVLALTKKREILLVKQFRPALETVTIELPSGHVDDGKTPMEAARCELLEETGYKAGEFKFLGLLTPDVGRLSNKLWCFFTKDAVRSEVDDPEEGVEVLKCSINELDDYIKKGVFNHALNIAVLFLAKKENVI